MDPQIFMPSPQGVIGVGNGATRMDRLVLKENEKNDRIGRHGHFKKIHSLALNILTPTFPNILRSDFSILE